MSTSSTTAVPTPACPAWCEQESGHDPEEIQEGHRCHRGPSFGSLTVYACEDLADGSIAFEALADRDDFHHDGLRQLAADAAAALIWIEAAR